jgi:hypothetical protein
VYPTISGRRCGECLADLERCLRQKNDKPTAKDKVLRPMEADASNRALMLEVVVGDVEQEFVTVPSDEQA